MIGERSPFRKIPIGSSRPLALCLDGLRQTAEVVDLAFQKLCGLLIQRVENARAGIPTAPLAESFMYAWSIADAADKFGQTLRTSYFKDLLVAVRRDGTFTPLQHAREMRNVADHPSERLELLAANRPGMTGALSWVVTNEFGIFPCSIHAGCADGDHQIYLPGADEVLARPIDKVRLRIAERDVDLGAVEKSIRAIIARIEPQLDGQLVAGAAHMGDQFVWCEVTEAAKEGKGRAQLHVGFVHGRI